MLTTHSFYAHVIQNTDFSSTSNHFTTQHDVFMRYDSKLCCRVFFTDRFFSNEKKPQQHLLKSVSLHATDARDTFEFSSMLLADISQVIFVKSQQNNKTKRKPKT